MTEDQRKITLRDGQEAGGMLLDIEARIGELLPEQGENLKTYPRGEKGQTIKPGAGDAPRGITGISHKRAGVAKAISKHPEIVERVKAQAKENPAVIIETVRETKKFLDGELGKYGNWDEFKNSHLIKLLDGSRKEDFARLKEKGVGQTTILKFLGGNWKQWHIQCALEMINDKNLDLEAIKP